MKKIQILSLSILLAFGALFLSNCGPDEGTDPVKPSLNFLADSATYVSANTALAANTDFTIAITASHSDKLKSLTVTKAINGGAAVEVLDSSLSEKIIAKYEFNGKTGAEAAIEVYTFTVADKDGNSTSKSITITNIGVGGKDLINFEEDNNGNPFVVYNFRAPIGFLGAYELGFGPLASTDPNSGKDIQDSTNSGETWPARWTSRNGSTFKRISGDKWNTVKNDATIKAAWDGATGETDVISLAEANVYLVKIKGSTRLGIILITKLDRSVSKREFTQFVYRLQEV
jgi:hypothetical protein